MAADWQLVHLPDGHFHISDCAGWKSIWKPYFLQRYDFKTGFRHPPKRTGVPGYAKWTPALRKEKLYYAAYNTSHNTHCIRNPAVCLCNAVLCRKKLKEGFLLGWCLFALFLFLQALFRHSASVPGLSLFFRSCTDDFIRLSGPVLFKISEYVSVLSRKIRNLPCRFPFKPGNERILTELQQLTGKNKTEL